MEERENEKCWKKLAYKAKNSGDVTELRDLDTNFKKFAAGWIKRVQDPGPIFEKFIFLWFTFNSWLSLVVPDDTQNDNDQYLLHSISASERFDDRFESLLKEDDQFAKYAQELTEKGPIFRVIWMKNKGLEPWSPKAQERLPYVKMFFEENPFKRVAINTESVPQTHLIPQFSPACTFEQHINSGGLIPRDWLHTMHMIYQIRCNLFHGGKTYDSSRDERFVTLAFNILWPMFREENFIKRLVR